MSYPSRLTPRSQQAVSVCVQQASAQNTSNLAIYCLAFFLTTLGIVYVQEAERKIPMSYASRYRAGGMNKQAYLPFKVRRSVRQASENYAPCFTGSFGRLASRQFTGACMARRTQLYHSECRNSVQMVRR